MADLRFGFYKSTEEWAAETRAESKYACTGPDGGRIQKEAPRG